MTGSRDVAGMRDTAVTPDMAGSNGAAGSSDSNGSGDVTGSLAKGADAAVKRMAGIVERMAAARQIPASASTGDRPSTPVPARQSPVPSARAEAQTETHAEARGDPARPGPMTAQLEAMLPLMAARVAMQEPPPTPPAEARSAMPDICLIAASTGGPMALERILAGLGPVFHAPIIVVQHMLPSFSGMLSHDLDTKTALRVKEAESGERIVPGTVYMAPGNLHILLTADKRVELYDGPMINGVRPAADVLFKSVASNLPLAKVFVAILTGMGRDGERGLVALKARRYFRCVTQSARTCVVYGMPRAAVESGLSDITLDLPDIAGEMERYRFGAQPTTA